MSMFEILTFVLLMMIWFCIEADSSSVTMIYEFPKISQVDFFKNEELSRSPIKSLVSGPLGNEVFGYMVIGNSPNLILCDTTDIDNIVLTPKSITTIISSLYYLYITETNAQYLITEGFEIFNVTDFLQQQSIPMLPKMPFTKSLGESFFGIGVSTESNLMGLVEERNILILNISDIANVKVLINYTIDEGAFADNVKLHYFSLNKSIFYGIRNRTSEIWDLVIINYENKEILTSLELNYCFNIHELAENLAVDASESFLFLSHHEGLEIYDIQDKYTPLLNSSYDFKTMGFTYSNNSSIIIGKNLEDAYFLVFLVLPEGPQVYSKTIDTTYYSTELIQIKNTPYLVLSDQFVMEIFSMVFYEGPEEIKANTYIIIFSGFLAIVMLGTILFVILKRRFLKKAAQRELTLQDERNRHYTYQMQRLPNRTEDTILATDLNENQISRNQFLEQNLVCPLTGEMMKEPVIIADGFTYEKAAIELWLNTNDISPITGLLLRNKQMQPNLVVAQMLETYHSQGSSSFPLHSNSTSN